MRLIDAEALENEIVKVKRYVPKDAVLDVACMVNRAPTIEAKPVVHAHWGKYWDYNCDNYSYCCSNCGKDALTKEGTMYDQVLTKFCPYCGAQMDFSEEKDE